MEHLSLASTIEALRRQLNINTNPMNMPDFNFSDSDLCCDFGSDPEPKFLDEYTEEDFQKILRENGFYEDLKSLGYTQTIFRMECKDKFVHRISLLDRSLMTSYDQPITEKNFLMDMFMRKKDLVTYQLKAYQDLKYRANRLTNTDAEILDVIPDVPEKRKFKPDYLKDNDTKKKEKTLKLRNLSDFSKIDKHLADNLKEANASNANTSSLTDTSSNATKTNSTTNNNNSQTGYNFSINLGRTFSLNRNNNPSTTHGSNVDIDVIEVSSASSYSEDEEEIKKNENENVSQTTVVAENGAKVENNKVIDEDLKTNTSSSSINVEIHSEHKDDKDSHNDIVKTNIINENINGNKLPLDPNTKPSKHERRTMKLPHKREKSDKGIEKKLNNSLDFGAFFNNLTSGNIAKRNNQPFLTATSVINSIFSFLNSTIKEEKPVAPILQAPESPPSPESSQESNDEFLQMTSVQQDQNKVSTENNETTKDDERNKKDDTDQNVASTKDENSNNDKKIDTDKKEEDEKNNIPKENEVTKDVSEAENNTKTGDGESSLHSSLNSVRSSHSNARMDMSLQPSSSEEIRKKKLTPLLVSKKGAAVLIKFLEQNINVVPEMKITEIEWVCMQNPRGTFTTKRPQCPGQRFPGLKMGRKISNLMVSLAIIRGRDGLCDTPEHFHNAAIYSQKGYMFINPAFHGYFVSLLYDLNKDMREHGLAAVSWAFKLGHVINRKTRKPEFWHPEEQIYPTSDRLHKYFISDQYLALVEHYRNVHLGRVYIDWNEARECLAYSIKADAIQRNIISEHENIKYEVVEEEKMEIDKNNKEDEKMEVDNKEEKMEENKDNKEEEKNEENKNNNEEEKKEEDKEEKI